MILRHLGRLVQRCDMGLLRLAERPMLTKDADPILQPLIAIAGPPRSGTTVTYQLLTQGLDVWFMNNLHYILYRTPVLGYRLARLLTRPYVSDYRSVHGFVAGLNGPAEANLFWQHWCDLHLEERDPHPKPDRLNRFAREMNTLWKLDGRPFLAGWLAHGFYISFLLERFPRSIIIRTQRDMLSTAVSVLRARRRAIRDDRLRWSLCPRDVEEFGHGSPAEIAAAQVYLVERAFDEQARQSAHCLLAAPYAEVCADPQGFVHQVAHFARRRGIDVTEVAQPNIPQAFTASKVQPDTESARPVLAALEALIAAKGSVSAPLTL